jgi:hypothetical protein
VWHAVAAAVVHNAQSRAGLGESKETQSLSESR